MSRWFLFVIDLVNAQLDLSIVINWLDTALVTRTSKSLDIRLGFGSFNVYLNCLSIDRYFPFGFSLNLDLLVPLFVHVAKEKIPSVKTPIFELCFSARV